MKPDFIQQAKKHKRRIVLPESDANRILEAAVYCDTHEIAEIILLGNSTVIEKQLTTLDLSVGNIQIVNPATNENSKAFAKTLSQLQSTKKPEKRLSKEQTEALSKQPLYFANLMVKEGLADGCVAGAINPTANVIRSALQTVGTIKPEARLSSFFIMLTPTLPTPVIFADCAINISPDATQLADIAYQSAKNATTLLGLDAKVALLSFSTNGSAQHENVDKIRETAHLLHTNHPEINVIGDIQFDAAVSNKILKKKWHDAHFEAPANVFIFPSLESGNICYKIAERIGGATAIGPILQGLAKPVNDLSRGADVESIINTIAVTCLQVKSKTKVF
ncbi:MAG: phosphate acetyltransferase [Cocleimonas sp.]